MKKMYTVEVAGRYYLTIDNFVFNQKDAVIFTQNTALKIKQKILSEKEIAKQALGFDFTEKDIVIRPISLKSLNMQRKSIMINECCPNCGREIEMRILEGTEKINFCPYCGQKDVYLCSECIEEIGDCQPSASCAYCHGHPNLDVKKIQYVITFLGTNTIIYRGSSKETAKNIYEAHRKAGFNVTCAIVVEK